MKRYVKLAVVAVALAFSSCSNDDPEPWQQLPDTPVSGEKLTVLFNGEQSYGVATLDAHNANGGSLRLENIVPGYPSVEVPVSLAEQSDGSFAVKGETTLDTPPLMLPSRADVSFPIYELTVGGVVSADGRVSLQVNSSLSAAARGNLVGTWLPAPFLPLTPEGFAKAPVTVTWVPVVATPQAEALSATLSLMAGAVVYQLLKAVSFDGDGNIRAVYSEGIDIKAAISDGIDKDGGVYVSLGDKWKESPRNLAFWFTVGDRMYVTPYLPNIMAQIAIDNGKDPDLDNGAASELPGMLLDKLAAIGVDTESLSKMLEQCNKTGLPLICKSSADGLSLTLPDEVARVLISSFLPALPYVDKIIEQRLEENPADEAMLMLVKKIFPALGITKLADLAKVLGEETKQLSVTMNFVRLP